MNEFKKCPDGFVDIGGICVPKKRVVRRSNNYESLFGRDSATHNIPVDIPDDIQDIPDEPVDDTPTVDLIDQPLTPAIPDNPFQGEQDEYKQTEEEVDDNDDNNRTPLRPDDPADHSVVVPSNEPPSVLDNTFSKNGETGEWTLSSDGVISLIYDNGEQEFIQPDEYADFLNNEDYIFSQRLMPFLIPYITPEINLQIFQAGKQEKQNELIDEVGYDSSKFTGNPTGNEYYYLDTNGEQHTGTYNIFRGEGPNNGTVRLVDANGRVSTYSVAEYNDLLKSQNTIFSTQFYDDVGEYTDFSDESDAPDAPPVPEELDYQVIENFTYRKNGLSITGGSAHLYDNQIIIYDSNGRQVAISSVTHWEGDSYLTVYSNEAVIYSGTSGQIQGMPRPGTLPPERIVVNNDVDAEEDDDVDDEE